MRLTLLAVIALTASAQPSTLDDQRVAQLARTLSTGELESLICSAPKVSFNLTPAYTNALVQAGVTVHAVKLMAARENGHACEPGIAGAAPPPVATMPQPREEPQAEVESVPAVPASQPSQSAPRAEFEAPRPSGGQTPIPAGVSVCLEPMVGGFDSFLIGEMQKQQVPVVIIAASPTTNPNRPEACDPNRSLYEMTGIVVPEGKSFSARSVFGLRVHYRDEVQAAVKLVRTSDNSVVWAGDSDRGEAKKVAEHIVRQMLKQRPAWIPSPINR